MVNKTHNFDITIYSLFKILVMMKKNYLLVLVLLLSGILSTACKSPENTIKFAIISDLHGPDVPDGQKRLETFVKVAQKEKVDFIINLGDFCRLDSTSMTFLTIWNSFKGNKYHVMGNHDVDKYTVTEYISGIGMPERYYSFDEGEFHFIVLDGNNLFDGQKYTHYAKGNNYKANENMHDYIDAQQLKWLETDLRRTDKKCVLFSHQSIDTFLKNGAEVRTVLENENQHAGFKKVVLAFSGHNHSNYTKEINGITYMQINSASYVWINRFSQTEKRYSEEVNRKYPLLKHSITYDQPLYAIVTLNNKRAKIKGSEAHFIPPTPKDLNMKDSIGVFPLVSVIENKVIDIE
jgi:predicted phosphodiesterase